MKKEDYLKFLEMRHARALGELNSYVARANRETALEGWTTDWSIGMDIAIDECRKVEIEYITKLGEK